MHRLNRRRFLQTSLAAGTGIALGGTKLHGAVLGSNDRIRVAVAGLHGRGKSHIDGLAGLSKERVGSEVLRLLEAPDPARHLRPRQLAPSLVLVIIVTIGDGFGSTRNTYAKQFGYRSGIKIRDEVRCGI